MRLKRPLLVLQPSLKKKEGGRKKERKNTTKWSDLLFKPTNKQTNKQTNNKIKWPDLLFKPITISPTNMNCQRSNKSDMCVFPISILHQLENINRKIQAIRMASRAELLVMERNFRLVVAISWFLYSMTQRLQKQIKQNKLYVF